MEILNASLIPRILQERYTYIDAEKPEEAQFLKGTKY